MILNFVIFIIHLQSVVLKQNMYERNTICSATIEKITVFICISISLRLVQKKTVTKFSFICLIRKILLFK